MSYWLYTKYMYFHFRCDDMGFDLVSNLFKRIAIQEMMHVEQLAERILFLKGEVEMKVAGEVRKLTEVKDMLEQAVKMEMNSVDDYNKWANECAANADSVSKKLLPKKKFIRISLKPSWIIWRNSEIIIWPYNL